MKFLYPETPLKEKHFRPTFPMQSDVMVSPNYSEMFPPKKEYVYNPLIQHAKREKNYGDNSNCKCGMG